MEFRVIERSGPMAQRKGGFNPKTFLTTVGIGRKMMPFTKGQTIYSLNDAADALFVIQQGQVKLSVKPHAGKEAILDILNAGDFVGKDSVAGQPSRTASASAMTDCILLRIENKTMLHALTRHIKLANMFWAYVLARNIRYQQDLVDQHCSSRENRLARVLLLLAHYDGHGVAETTFPKMKHETLAEMVGTTRSRISFFMSRFKESGFIFYENKGKLLRVHRSLFAFRSK
jgi:CRP/FNR family transcriptional regulator, cyclic AMP receptor protein